MPNDIYAALIIVHKELIMSLIYTFFHAKRGGKKGLVD